MPLVLPSYRLPVSCSVFDAPRCWLFVKSQVDIGETNVALQ